MTVLRYSTPESLGLNSNYELDVDDPEMVMTPEIRTMVRCVLETVVAGKAVIVSTPDELLTSTQAAEALSISRPTLYHLLDTGELPSTTAGSRRQVPVWAVTAYQLLREDRIPAERYASLTEQLRDIGLTDTDVAAAEERGATPEDYVIADRILADLFESPATL
jgi:excisionase family DNA binding protein